MNTNTRKTLLASMVGLFAAVSVGAVQAQSSVESSSKFMLEEIVVTSTKRATNLSDTAASISAIGSEEINRRGITDMDDYLRFTPGVSFIDRGAGRNTLVVRGIAADVEGGRSATGPTVGTYFGESPTAGLSWEGGGLDLKLIDIEQVEVIRGPQGTLYGAGSLSGTVRTIPNGPDLSIVEGGFRGEYSETSGHGSENTKYEGVLNVPIIEDVMAVRGVLYRHDNSGYVKNVSRSTPGYADIPDSYGAGHLVVDKDDMGADITEGARLSFLWQVTEDFKVNLQYIKQDIEQNGESAVNLGLEDEYSQRGITSAGGVFDSKEGLMFPHNKTLNNTGREEEADLTNLVMEYDFGWASLLSSTTILEQDAILQIDVSPFVGGIPIPQIREFESEALVEEIRLVSQFDGPLQFIAGLYYEDIEVDDTNTLRFSGDPSLNPFPSPPTLVPGDDGSFVWESLRDRNRSQKAVFGEVSYEFSEEFTLTAGARHFRYDKEALQVSQGAFGFENTYKETDETGNSYKLNLSYTPDDDTLVYAQWAEGFRLGNAQPSLPIDACDTDSNGILDGTDAPITDRFDSDTLDNYELGVKMSLLDSRVDLSAAIYHMDWKGIPLLVTSPTCFFPIVVNAGKAISQGVEFDLSYLLTENLVVNLGASFSKAEITEDVPALGAVDGDSLPGSPDYTFNLGLRYDFQINGYSSYVSSDYAYVDGFHSSVLGDRSGGEESDNYGQWNVKASTDISENMTVELFVNNLTDGDAITSDMTTSAPLDEAYRQRPRTSGLALIYSF